MSRVLVVGAGVVGLSAAHELAVAGHQVRVVADHEAVAGVSGVAAAICFPHGVPLNNHVLTSTSMTYRRLVELAHEPAAGVRIRTGTMLFRDADPDLSWTAAIPEHRRRPDSDVPIGATGIECTLPLAVTNVYLGWLRDRVVDLGVTIAARRVTSIDELLDAESGCDAVVVAAGLRSAELLGDDDEVYPVRGQVVRLANPGLSEWVIDGQNPAGMTYVIPRDGDVVCGGTDEIGSYDETVHPEVEAAILQRATDLVPALRGRPVLSRAVGLRPGRPTVRVEAVPGHRVPVFASYGHGGAGFTLSWGDAASIVAMIGEL